MFLSLPSLSEDHVARLPLKFFCIEWIKGNFFLSYFSPTTSVPHPPQLSRPILLKLPLTTLVLLSSNKSLDLPTAQHTTNVLGGLQPTTMDTFPQSLEGSEHARGDDEKTLEGLEAQNNHGATFISKVRTAQDWEGPDDPENPLNWPIWKKVYHTTMVGLLCFTM
jgi:hypothetical protein